MYTPYSTTKCPYIFVRNLCDINWSTGSNTQQDIKVIQVISVQIKTLKMLDVSIFFLLVKL